LTREVYPNEEFKKYSKYFVFLKINVDHQPRVAQMYSVRAMPTLKFLKADGSVVYEFLGFRPLPQFLEEMNKGKQAAGL
jgi:thioredoxin-like negative regulator of GroEL